MLSAQARQVNQKSIPPTTPALSGIPHLQYCETEAGDFRLINLGALVAVGENDDGCPMLTLLTGETVVVREKLDKALYLLISLGYVEPNDLPDWMQEAVEHQRALRRILPA